jgi:ABC-type nitrate/sulfonate/bicarbonate transport system substrate-binding protein
VAAIVGPDGVEDAMKLVEGGSEDFHAYLVDDKITDAQATSLCQQLEVFAARTLFDKSCPELPSGFVAAIEKAREVSDALESQPA